jgi:phospholipase C
MASTAAPSRPPEAGDLPFPDKPIGAVNEDMPFDHIVVVMMENHSFDNLLGGLGRTRPDVDGLTFDASGKATNSNPGLGPQDEVTAFPLADTAQAKSVTQSWKATHEQINGAAMNGFVSSEKGATEAMGYYTPEVLPFAYSLASTFTLADHWFCSVPGPTYPNRRFLLAGTAFGGTTSEPGEVLAAFDTPPPNGTIFNRLSEHGITWANYFTDIPMAVVIPRILPEHPFHLHPRSKFLQDCRAGSLPSVSFVDPAMGLSSIADAIKGLPKIVKDALDGLDPGETEEDPDDMYYGERWAHETVEAVLRSPAWPRTLLIYTYDEHGGYYDHVPPPFAVAPDDIPPKLQPGEPGDYRMYGPRVPTTIVSPYSRPGGVSSTVYDHTSVLATIESKWNLPALTNRDANAATIMDCLDLSSPGLLKPEPLEAPSESGPSGPVTETA